MRLSRFLLLFGFLSLALAMSAQQRKNNARTVRNSLVTPTKPTVDVHHLIEVYDWAKASAALQSLVQSTKEASAKDSLQSLLRSVRRAEEMMATTQQIVFIDSVVVDKSKLLSAIKMSEEAGKLLPSAQVFPHRNNATLWSNATFVNPLESTAIFAAPYGHNQSLQSVFRTGNGWTPAAPLAGIDSTFNAPDYPFLLSDGTTLYFSAKGAESIGGYDIFVTRYNPDTRQYVKPTNVGMPFNSPANEYLYAVDPTMGIGLLATDRRQPEGKVCIYSFLVPSERKDYDSERLSSAELRQFAQISSIAQTQIGQTASIKTVQQRKAQQKQQLNASSTSLFRFVVNDNKVYHSADDFTNKEARALVPQWFKAHQQRTALQQQCDTAELAYARQRTQKNEQQLAVVKQQLSAITAHEKALAQQIRQLELAQ